MAYLCLTITFLDPRFHGRGDGGAPEWPPSPLRLYQAIVAAAAAPTGEISRLEPALRWFEHLGPPTIVAPAARIGAPYRLSVPNNAMDLVARAWAKGVYDGAGDANPSTHRAMKTVRPTHLVGGDQVRYLWKLPEPISQEDQAHAHTIAHAARGIVALGWGIDLVVGHGEILVDENPQSYLVGQRWEPTSSGSHVMLRVAAPGTLDALVRRHTAFRNRVTVDGFNPVPPLSVFSTINYRRPTDPLLRPYAAFALRQVNEPSQWRPFRQERVVCVAAMMRHVACEAAQIRAREDPKREPWAEQFVAGHGPRDLKRSFPRFSYLPLPTVSSRHGDGMIRRILVAEPFGGSGSSAEWALQRLGGEVLIDEGTGEAIALLQPLKTSDGVLNCYTQSSRFWHSITPVIVPGFDDHKPARRDRLLRQCLENAGIETMAVECLEARPASFDRASIPSQSFKRPKYLIGLPALHVRIIFRFPIAGPMAIGAGRHCGLGLLAGQLP